MLNGWPILIVEDEPMIGLGLTIAIEDLDGQPIGPVATIAEALALIASEQIAAAILDANLLDRDVTPLALHLLDRSVPFVVHAGTGLPSELAARHPDLPVVMKPASALVHPRRICVSEANARYVELQVTTHFSFLRGASSAEDLFATAALMELPALGIVDRNSVAGIVRAWDAEKATGVRAIIGCRLDLTDGTALLVYPTDKAAYGRMCRLLSIGKSRAGKGACHLDWSDVEEWHKGLLAILVPDRADVTTQAALAKTKRLFGKRAHMALSVRRRPKDAIRLRDLSGLAAAASAKATRTFSPLSQAISNPSEHQRVLRRSTATRPS